MLEIFMTDIETNQFTEVNSFQKGCWINLCSPTEDELSKIEMELGILSNFLRDPLDEEEKPRVDVEDDQTLIIVDIPRMEDDDNDDSTYETVPLGIIITNDFIITICLYENEIIDTLKMNRMREFFTFKKTRFTFQLLFVTAKEYLRCLRHIDKKSDELERTMRESMKNDDLFKLLELEKSLVFFTTSLKSNEIVMEKLLRMKKLKMYEEDEDLLEDVIIENKQAIEMANIYSSTLNVMMGTFASVISNNLNVVMKFLASMTIVISVPTLISGIWGMNVPVPWGNHPLGFIIVGIIALAASGISAFILWRKKMF